MDHESPMENRKSNSFPVAICDQGFNDRLIHVLCFDRSAANKCDLIKNLNLKTQVFTSIEESQAAAEKVQPSAVLNDSRIFESKRNRFEAIRDYQCVNTKIILLAENVEYDFAKKAYDAGVWRVLKISEDTESLSRSVLALQAVGVQSSGCVFYAGENNSENEAYVNALQQNDFKVYTLNRLDALFQYLESTKPDVLIIDNGICDESLSDLLGVIRLCDTYASMCVIVVAKGYDADIQQAVITSEGENYFVTPSSRHEFVQAVISRTSRAQDHTPTDTRDGRPSSAAQAANG